LKRMRNVGVVLGQPGLVSHAGRHSSRGRPY
jgi:hypothetical protein